MIMTERDTGLLEKTTEEIKKQELFAVLAGLIKKYTLKKEEAECNEPIN